MGRWYLLSQDGTLRVVDWQRLIDTWKLEDDLKLAMHCAFARSDALYGARWKLVFDDPDVRAVLQTKFDRLAKRRLTVTGAQLRRHTIAEDDVGFAFPYSDAATYALHLWIASPEGVERTSWDEDERYLTAEARKLWDAPVLSLSPNYGSVALAAGDEGLYEMQVDAPKRTLHQTLEHHCSSCDWLFYSVYASSHLEHGALAAFNSYKAGRDEATGRQQYERVFAREVEDEQIFAVTNGGYSWGSGDKICKVAADGIHVTRYSPGNPRLESQFSSAGLIAAPRSALRPVDAAVTHFGVVVEAERGMTVFRSDGQRESFRGAPVNWRTFHRSNWYLNQLHLVRDDRIDVVSFNHDFFVDQRSKISGIRFRERADPRPRRQS